MPTQKRKSPEKSNDDQPDEDPNAFPQREDNAKRIKLTTSSDASLQSLPVELIERILITVVVMEVKGTKLAKSMWKEKAEPVISRLRSVCSQWNNLLTSDFFHNELHRTLDRTAQKIRLEILHQSQLDPNERLMKATTMKDEIFISCYSILDHLTVIRVYDRWNMAEVKEVIPLPANAALEDIAACSVSNCVYLLFRPYFLFFKIGRVAIDDQGQFAISHETSDMELQGAAMAITTSGSVIMSGWLESASLYVIRSYDTNFSLQHEIKCTWLSTMFRPIYAIIPKSNGNLLLSSFNDSAQCYLTEISANGTILRKYQSSSGPTGRNHCAGVGERTLMSESLVKMELLDSEFNLLDFTYSQLATVPKSLHYNHERNELITIANSVLTISKFLDE